MSKLHISETFVSMQGEGISVGCPAVFLRLKGCVLNCSFCDTAEVWKQGTAYDIPVLFDLFSKRGWFQLLADQHHLIVTGGDPLLQQSALVDFFDYCMNRNVPVDRWTIEVENQGSLMPSPMLLPYIAQWNISPKLSNSGEPFEKRIKPDILRAHATNCQAVTIFKFPIKEEEELQEVEHIRALAGIRKSQVQLMPLCSTRKEHEEVGRKVAAMCIREGYGFSPRLHLALWDMTTGV